MPSEEIVALGHSHDVPVYPCISASGMTRRKPYGPGSVYGAEAWLAAAANTFCVKADGVSLFNLFPRPGADEHNALVNRVFTQAGDPATLTGKNKLFCLDNAAHMAGCGYINHVVPYQRCLPKTVEPGKTLRLALPVGEDVCAAKSIGLRLQTDRQASVQCRLNGQPLAPAPAADLAKRFGMTWRVAPIKANIVKKGTNRVEIDLDAGADKPTTVTGLELDVRYA
jgi:hypothetical protein